MRHECGFVVCAFGDVAPYLAICGGFWFLNFRVLGSPLLPLPVPSMLHYLRQVYVTTVQPSMGSGLGGHYAASVDVAAHPRRHCAHAHFDAVFFGCLQGFLSARMPPIYAHDVSL